LPEHIISSQWPYWEGKIVDLIICHIIEGRKSFHHGLPYLLIIQFGCIEGRYSILTLTSHIIHLRYKMKKKELKDMTNWASPHNCEDSIEENRAHYPITYVSNYHIFFAHIVDPLFFFFMLFWGGHFNFHENYHIERLREREHPIEEIWSHQNIEDLIHKRKILPMRKIFVPQYNPKKIIFFAIPFIIQPIYIEEGHDHI